jgi:hypothetical protein
VTIKQADKVLQSTQLGAQQNAQAVEYDYADREEQERREREQEQDKDKAKERYNQRRIQQIIKGQTNDPILLFSGSSDQDQNNESDFEDFDSRIETLEEENLERN